jgi:amino acid transporter
LIFYLFTTLALFKLRKEEVGVEGIYKVPLYPVLPIIYFTGLLLLVFIRAYYEWEKSLVDLAFIATGIPFAWWFVRKQGSGK